MHSWGRRRQVQEIWKQLNALLTAVDTSTDYASLKLNIQTACKAIVTSLELPNPPEAPTV